MQDKPIRDKANASSEDEPLARISVSPRIVGALCDNADSILLTLRGSLEEATAPPGSGPPESPRRLEQRHRRIAEQEQLLRQLHDIRLRQRGDQRAIELSASSEALRELVQLALSDIAENVAVDCIYAWEDRGPLDEVRQGIDQLFELLELAERLGVDDQTRGDA